MNTNDATIKLQKFFLESNDQTTSNIASHREEIVKDVNELLGFGHKESWPLSGPGHITSESPVAKTIKSKLSSVGLMCMHLSGRQYEKTADGNSAIHSEFYRVGDIKSGKKLELWLKVEHPDKSDSFSYYLTTKSPFDN